MNVVKQAWSYTPVRWAAIIAGITAGALLLLPGLHFGGYSANQFLPHATCYLRDPGVIWLNVISDSFIALAYLSISATLGYIVYRARHDIPFHWMFGAFGLFIVACGFTHVMGVVTVWRPYYWLAGDVKAVTAVASVATAVILPLTVPRVFSMIHDAKVSDERKHQLEIANEKLRESDELKSQFFANVSHELRTPLSLILGPLERQLARADLRDEEREELEVAERNAGLLLQQVNNLLDLARLDARGLEASYERADLAAEARLAASYFEGLAGDRRIDFRLDTPDSMPAEVDTDKVRRIFLNLVSNAFKFTPEDGAVRSELTAEGDEAVFTIDDSGPGIPETMREVIFERFRQVEGGASRRAGGTGLGLAIVKEFVAAHGGHVGVEASQLGGARFVVRLPLRAPEGADVTSADDRPVPSGHHAVDELRSYQRPAQTGQTEVRSTADQPLVLVVEDNREMNAFIARTLGDRFAVATAFSGREGLEQARRLHPDLIVTDLMMPGMSGDEMISELNADPDLRETPVIVLTAKADDRQRVELLEEGVYDHLTKPFAAEELLARVDGLLRRRQESIAELRRLNESLERRVEERTEAIRHQAGQLRRLASDLSATEQRERRRLAQALHDHVQQLLVTAKLGFEQLPTLPPEELGAHAVRMGEVLDHALRATRGVTLELYPPVLYDAGLAAGLRWFGRQAESLHGLKVEVDADPEANPTDEDLQAFLFDAVRELLLNVSKHARTDRASVSLKREGGMAIITVEDAGTGCDPDALLDTRHAEGFGLFNIRERVAVLGGRVSASRTDSGGCRVRIECPLEGRG